MSQNVSPENIYQTLNPKKTHYYCDTWLKKLPFSLEIYFLIDCIIYTDYTVANQFIQMKTICFKYIAPEKYKTYKLHVAVRSTRFWEYFQIRSLALVQVGSRMVNFESWKDNQQNEEKLCYPSKFPLLLF